MSEPLPPERSRESAEILSLAQAQYETAGTIYGSSDPAEILDALVNFVELAYEQAELALLDEDIDPNTLNVLAEFRDKRVYAVQRKRKTSEYPAFDTYSAIEVLNVINVRTDPFLEDSERERLISEDVHALLVIPMVVTQRLIGVIAFRSKGAVDLSNARLRALRNLVDQAAVIFENQALLRNTAASLAEVRTLYDVNRAMLATVDMIDVMRVLRQNLAPEADTLFHIVAADNPDSASNYLLRQITTRDDERDVQEPLTLTGDLLRFNEESTSVTFVESAAQARPTHPLHTLLVNRGAVSYAVINIRERGHLQDMIAFTFKQPQGFEPAVRRLYTAVADQTAIVLQNQRLLVEAQMNAAQANQQLRTLQTINRVSIALSQTTDEQELLSTAVRAITEASGADHGGMMLMDNALAVGHVVAEYPIIGAAGQDIPLEGNPLVEIFKYEPSRHVEIVDLATDPRMPPAVSAILNGLGIHGMVILPLLLQERLIGSVGLDINERGRRLDPDAIQTAVTMTAQLVIALQNLRLISDSERRASQLQKVAEFGQSVQATLSEDAIFDLVFAETLQMLPTDSLMIALYDEKRGALRVVAQRRSPSDTQPISLNISLTGTLHGRAWEYARTMVVNDLMREKPLAPIPGIASNTRSVLITPILSRQQPLGLVMVTSASPFAYTETDIAIFEQMISQLAVALENSRAFQESQRVAQNEALINTISAQYQRFTGLDEMMQVTLRELGHALKARRARARFITTSEPTVSE